MHSKRHNSTTITPLRTNGVGIAMGVGKCFQLFYQRHNITHYSFYHKLKVEVIHINVCGLGLIRFLYYIHQLLFPAWINILHSILSSISFLFHLLIFMIDFLLCSFMAFPCNVLWWHTHVFFIHCECIFIRITNIVGDLFLGINKVIFFVQKGILGGNKTCVCICCKS